MEFRSAKQSLRMVIRWWRKIQISVVRNPNIRGPIQCPVVAPIATPMVTKYGSIRRAQPYSLYSCYSESKLSIWSDTHIYTFSIYLESSPSFCICSRMFTSLQNYLDHSSVHGAKRCLACVLFIDADGKIKGNACHAGSTNSRWDMF